MSDQPTIQTLPVNGETLTSIPATTKVVKLTQPDEKKLLTICATIYVNAILNQRK
ncbi:MAG: hypothetical protein ACT4OJ_12910 [Bacteroidota bacterium]